MTTPTLNIEFKDPEGQPFTIPAEFIGGIAEVRETLARTGKFARQYPENEGGIPPTVISNWADRRATTGFPEPLPFNLGRGKLWDLREVERWEGPPGRWPRVDFNDEKGEGW